MNIFKKDNIVRDSGEDDTRDRRYSDPDLQHPADKLDPVAAFTGIQAPDGTVFKSQNALSELAQLRTRFPFLSITPIPQVMTAVCVSPNTSYELKIPDTAVMGCLRSDGDFYASFSGRCQAPNLLTGELGSSQMVNPDFGWLYISDKRVLHVLSVTAGRVVQLQYFTRDQAGK